VRDLEEKIKSYQETTITSSESMTDLKREVARFKDSETSSSQYITELEARLSRSDESVMELQQTVEMLEKKCERREEEINVLQTRLDNITRDGESWRTDLEEREKKVVALEVKMQEWERKKREAADDRQRLGNVIGEVVQARKSLEALTPANGSEGVPSGICTPQNKGDLELEAQHTALKETHAATLADLASVTAKYRDALREISDLAAQIQEAKLSEPPSATPPPIVEAPPSRRRLLSRSASDGRGLAEPQYNAAGKRLFFREAASADSLHAR